VHSFLQHDFCLLSFGRICFHIPLIWGSHYSFHRKRTQNFVNHGVDILFWVSIISKVIIKFSRISKICVHLSKEKNLEKNKKMKKENISSSDDPWPNSAQVAHQTRVAPCSPSLSG
jgi:hypothetical protein